MTDISLNSAPSSGISAPADNTPESPGAHKNQGGAPMQSEVHASDKTDTHSIAHSITENKTEPSDPERTDDGGEPDSSESPAERRLRAGAERLLGSWLKQSEEAAALYPGFDLSRELHGERFRSLLRSGIDVRTAYEVVHRDEIIPAAMRSAFRDAEEKLARSLATASLRPDESAGKGAPSFIGGVKNLSRADRDSIAKRVARGERIVF